MSNFNSGPMASDPVPSSLGYKPKYLKAKVVLELPAIEADAQMWETYDVKEMANRYAGQLVENLLEELETPYENGDLEITPTVEIVDNP